MTDTPDDAAAPDLRALLFTTKTLGAFLTALARAALALAPTCDGCGITLERQGHPLTVASSGKGALKLDEKQYGQDDGPCLEALRTGQEISVSETRTEKRWGAYPAYAAASGNRSSLSVPIAPLTHTAGALNLYAPRPGAFAGADLAPLRSLATQAAGSIALAQLMADVETFHGELHQALATRATVDQAIGITMAEHGFSREQAFAHLRSVAHHRGAHLHQVCSELVSAYGAPPPGHTGPAV
jgi:GAF domain-containing protein